MQTLPWSSLQPIHRHTGGLEIIKKLIWAMRLIHRHTGGLEIRILKLQQGLQIHRHTGGLEKSTRQNGT